MNKTILSLLMLLCVNAIFAQQKLFEATLFENETGTTITDAVIAIETEGISTTSDDSGKFVFKGDLPEGTYFVTITKDGYENQGFHIKTKKGFNIKIAEIIYLTVTKDEEKRRKNEAKNFDKEEKERLKELEKEAKYEAKIEAERLKDLERNGGASTVAVAYTPTDQPVATLEPIPEVEPEPEDEFSANQIKYADILGVDVTDLTNRELYDFIDDWMGTPYLMGGETEAAIDCSSFSQRLFIASYDSMYLERTAQKQFNSKNTELFGSKKHLSEGDLIFFGKDNFNVTHVGVYLHNNKFVHSTSTRSDGPSGVKISDLTYHKWAGMYISAGRRSKSN